MNRHLEYANCVQCGQGYAKLAMKNGHCGRCLLTVIINEPNPIFEQYFDQHPATPFTVGSVFAPRSHPQFARLFQSPGQTVTTDESKGVS